MKLYNRSEQLYNNKHITKRLGPAFNYKIYSNVHIILFL
jgi:hypothetical protein